MTSYKTLKKIFYDASLSSDIAGILHWDMSTMMPVLLGMLGLGAMRTVEKTQKVSREK